MATADTTSVGAVLAEHMVGRLVEYRRIVAAAARGEAINGKDAGMAEKHLRWFGLPAYAFARDVRAAAAARTATGHCLRELEWNHPHVFTDPDAWVRERVEAARRRVRS